ncbi:vegetative incompatibility protein het-e-1 [Colletotrichum camelliae]|nr:vegetative incompatibility protein het-e-1 [Colletotrichum camelliae]
MEAVGVLANVIAVVDLSVKLGIVCGEYISKARNAKDDIRKLKEESDALARIIGQVQDLLGDNGTEQSHRRQLNASETFRNDVEQCETTLRELTERLDPGKNPSRFRLIGKSLKWPFTSNEVSQNVESLRHWRDCFLAALQIDHMHLALQREDIEDIKNLPSSPGASFDSRENDSARLCHPDTRQELLRDILEWADDPDGRCIFWLRGPAGTGKSTISKTVAKVFADRGQLAASFFFKRTQEGRNTGKLFVTTIARQIAGRVPKLKDLILRAIKGDQDLPDKSLELQFSKLVLEPLNCVELSGITFPTLILVVDALDECSSEQHSQLDNSLDSSRQIIQILSKLATVFGVKVRVFLTSRPEVPIRLGFLEDVPIGSHQDVALHDIPEPVIEHDIRAFIETELGDIRVSHSIARDWPGDDVVTQLVKASVPLFIYASTMCKFINDKKRRFRPQAQLDKILRQNRGFRTGIELAYGPILDQLLDDLDNVEKKELLAQFRKVVGAIILLADPLSIASLGKLLGIENDEIRYLLNSLHSVLDVPEDDQPERPIRLFHLSFREYLLEHLDGKNTFWIDEMSQHKELFDCCLRVMGDQSGFGLRNDICRLDDPGVRRHEIPREKIYQHIPRSLEYACRYWIMHLRESGRGIHVQNAHEFLTRYLLYWFEAMSWMDLLQQASGDLLILEDMFSSQEDSMKSEALSFLRDARRFLAENEYAINLAPCQVYVSALIFAPKASLVKQMFQCEVPGWIVKMPEVAEDWDLTSRTLHQYKSPVKAVAWSHDGQHVAVATWDDIDVWNASSGIMEASREMSHINCITFMPCGTIAIGLDSRRILLWDWMICSETTFNTGDGVVYIAAATTGKVVCGLSNGEINLMNETFDTIHTWYTDWDPLIYATKILWLPRIDSRGRVHFSHNGKFIALVDREQSNLVSVYDADSGTLIQHLSAPDHQIFLEVTISDEGVLFATFGSFKEESYEWGDVIMEALILDLSTTEGSPSPASPLVVSSPHCRRPTISNNRIVTCTGENSILKTWDLKDPSQLAHSLKHTNCFAVSPDGQYIVADVDTVQITSISNLDFVKHALGCTMDGNDEVDFNRQSLSPDGLRLAVVSSRGKVTLWHIGEDKATGSELAIIDTPWEIPSNKRNDFAIAWSSNGAFLAVASFVGFVVYDGSAQHPVILRTVSWEFKPSDDAFRQLSFSPCGSYIAITDGATKSVSLWNFPSCTCRWLQALQDPMDCFSAMTIGFSPDGAQLAVSHGYNARLIDSNTGAITWTRSFASFNVNFISSLAFSSSGALIAIKAILYDRKPLSIEPDSGASVNSERKSFDESFAFKEEMDDSDEAMCSRTRMFFTNVADGRHGATMSQATCLKTDPYYGNFGQIAYTLEDDFVVTQDTWFSNVEVARKESPNPIAQNIPCNIMMVRYGEGERWLTKFGRRLIHCPSSMAGEAAPQNWVLFPHRLHGYDSTRAAPFTIELTCTQCCS